MYHYNTTIITNQGFFKFFKVYRYYILWHSVKNGYNANLLYHTLINKSRHARIQPMLCAFCRICFLDTNFNLIFHLTPITFVAYDALELTNDAGTICSTLLDVEESFPQKIHLIIKHIQRIAELL